MSSLPAQYLDKINQGEAINMHGLIEYLNKSGMQYLASHVKAEHRIGVNKYVVTISNELRKQLDVLSVREGDTRSSAAKSYQSHAVGVAGSFMLYRRVGEHPRVITFSDNGDFHLDDEHAKFEYLLLVENRETFLLLERYLPALGDWVNDVTICLLDGNSGANKRHAKFFSQAQEIVFFNDLDVGGLSIASNIAKLCVARAGAQRMSFTIPYGASELLKNMSVKGALSNQDIDKIRKLSIQHPFLIDAANLLIKHRSKLEQEAFMSD